MAPALVKRVGAALLVIVACAMVLFAALGDGGERRSIAKFVPGGPMRALDRAAIQAVEVHHGDQRMRFDRLADGWRTEPQATAAQLQALEEGLVLLRNAAPERRFDAGDRPDDRAAGLAPPLLSVHVEGPVAFSIAFGNANPMGLARYARVGGDPATLLLPRYVADTWETAAGLRPVAPSGSR